MERMAARPTEALQALDLPHFNKGIALTPYSIYLGKKVDHRDLVVDNKTGSSNASLASMSNPPTRDFFRQP